MEDHLICFNNLQAPVKLDQVCVSTGFQLNIKYTQNVSDFKVTIQEVNCPDMRITSE